MELKGITEGLLFACGEEGITKKQIARALEVEKDRVDQLMDELINDYERADRGMMVVQSNDIYHLATKPEHSHFYKKIHHQGKMSRMSQAALETLAIIAYKQPITKVEIEELRGVDSDYAVKGLLKRSMIERAGRKETPGRPYFFITTKDFLAYFGLASLNDLPPLPDHFDTAGAEYEFDLFFHGNATAREDDD